MTNIPARHTNQLQRTYAATPEEVWELWTTASGIEGWWAPRRLRGHR